MKKVVTGIVCLVFILSLFLLYTNLHVHVVNNLLVTHSHPFDKGHSSKSPLKSHHHNSVEFLIYATLFNFDGIVLLLVFLFILSILVNFLSTLQVFFRSLNPSFLFPVLRAPPLF